MRFASPIFFVLIIPLVVVMYGSYRKKDQFQSLRFPMGQRGFDWQSSHFPVRRFILLGLRLCSFISLVIALASPQTLLTLVNRPEGFVEMILAVDGSSRMSESLGGLGRFQMAKLTLKDFIPMRADDRLGFMVFSQDGHLVVPPTLDHALLSRVVDKFQIGTLGASSNLGNAIGIGIKHLKESTARGRVLVLLTSGAQKSGRIGFTTATSLANNFGVRLYIISLEPKDDTAVSRVDNPLIKLAFRSGGKYFEAENTDSLGAAFKEIDQLEHYTGPIPEKAIWQERFQLALAIALLLLVLEFLISKTILRVLPN